MPNKMIPFPYEIKSTYCTGSLLILIAVTMARYFSSNKDRQSGSLFLFYFFIFVIMALGHMV